MARNPFREALAQAAADLLARGYQSEEQVRGWAERLRSAAYESLLPESTVRRKLAAALDRTYQATLRQLRRRHRGLSQFTVQQLTPELRRSLDQRILASASLIKLNREDAIRETLQRFEGWATAIPKGGTRAQTRGEADKELGRALQTVRFRERRVEVDQGHKLVSSINAVVAEREQAIAAVWHSHWREAGYDYREDHKKLDEQTLLIPGSWAVEEGYVKRTGVTFTDQVEAPGQEIYCRCYYTYLYALVDLPEELLTAKGKLALRGERHAANG